MTADPSKPHWQGVQNASYINALVPDFMRIGDSNVPPRTDWQGFLAQAHVGFSANSITTKNFEEGAPQLVQLDDIITFCKRRRGTLTSFAPPSLLEKRIAQMIPISQE